MSLAVLVWLGIVIVISIWLYGTYKTKEESLVSEVERSLFNTVQAYYLSGDPAKENNNRPFDKDGVTFIQEIQKHYPHMDQAKLTGIWDSLRSERTRLWSKKFKERKRTAIPFSMLQNLDFEEDDLVRVDTLFNKSLKSKGILAKVDLGMLSPTDEEANVGRRRYERTPEGDIKTRPILINPEKNLLLFATIKQPFVYVLWKMALHTTMSILLILALIVTFSYLLYTINKQNKMAILRKSFVNNMTHELKTPVATVMAAIEAVQRFGARDDKVKMAKYLDISHRELEHLSTLIERVLQLDMDEVNGLVLDKVSFDLNVLMEQCIDAAKLSCPKSISVDLIVENPSVFYFGDPSHIKNVFSNLLDNAIKYSDEKVHIVIRMEEYEDTVHIRIKDHGQGIAEQYLNDIFDIFFRVPAGNLHPVKGFGLGLSYVKLLVEKHGGRIEVRSKLGEGTTFKMILPKVSV